jgi:hypothetical protein
MHDCETLLLMEFLQLLHFSKFKEIEMWYLAHGNRLDKIEFMN